MKSPEPYLDDDGYCYGCGQRNPNGLRMRFEPLPDGSLESRVRFRSDHTDGAGAVHMGFVTLALDELAVEMLLHHGMPNVSIALRMSHLRPARPADELVMRASKGRAKAGLIEVEVEARDGAGPIARGTIACMRLAQEALAPGRGRPISVPDGGPSGATP